MTALGLTADEILARIDALPASQQAEAWALLASAEALPEGDPNEVDPLARLLDPSFTETTWDHDGSYVGPLPGRLHEKQLELLHRKSKHRWAFWGNQAGKSSLGAIDACLLALGRHPGQVEGWLRKPPVTIWASALTWELWEKILLPELLSWLPRSRVNDAPPPFSHSSKRDIVVRADNGTVSRITGKAAQQGSETYQSARVDLVWLDEEHPESVWDEMQPRLLRFGGRTLATMTPLLGMGTYVYGRIYDPVRRGVIPPERHWFSHAGISANPSITPEAIEELKAELSHSPAQLEARMEGHFTRPIGAVLAFDLEKHSVDVTDELRDRWKQRATWFAGIDLGRWRFAVVLGVVDGDGALTIVDEYFDQEGNTDMRAKGIDAMLRSWKVPANANLVADCADPVGVDDLTAALARINSPYRAYPIASELKARGAGVLRLQTLLARGALRARRGIGRGMVWRLGASAAKPGKPVMGSRWLWEIQNWRYPTMPDGKVQKDEPDDASADGADMMDATRYLAMEFYGPPESAVDRKRGETQWQQAQRELREMDQQTEHNNAKPDYGVVLRQ